METVTDPWHSTMAYDIPGRLYHVGRDWEGYEKLLRLVL